MPVEWGPSYGGFERCGRPGSARRAPAGAGPGLHHPFHRASQWYRKYLGRTRTGIELPGGVTSQTITRSDLYHGMHEAGRTGDRVNFGRRLAGIDESAAGAQAHFPNGSARREIL